MASQTGPSRPSRPRGGQPRTDQPRGGQPRTGQSRSGQAQGGGRPRTDRPRVDPARRAAFDALRAVDDRDAYANLLLPALLRERGLTGRDAAFATELTYGTLRGRGTYDAILAACSDRDDLDPPVRDVLRLGAHQLLATRVGSHAAVATSVDLAKDVCGPRPSGFVNAVLRRVATRDLQAWLDIVVPDRSKDLSGYLAVRHSYPRWIVDAFRDALGNASPAEIEDALAAGNVRPDVVLAVSSVDAPDFHPEGERTRWSPCGFRLAGGDPAPLVASGHATVQDEASQLAALALTRVGLSGQDSLWLDLCAGPGGKARLLAGLAAERGARLVASDVRPHRARRVLEALRRTPASSKTAPGNPDSSNADPGNPDPSSADSGSADSGSADPGSADSGSAVLVADGRRVPWPSGTFDRVLADVPCSGLGSLRRRPEARWRKTPEDVKGLAPLQRDLLNAAIDSVRPGGVVAYVTCTPHLAETQEIVTSVAAERDDVTILDAPALLPEVPDLRAPEPKGLKTSRPSRFAQFWPHRHGTDAIFLALLRRG